MSISDKDIDTGLQRLAQQAPERSVWAEIEQEITPRRSFLKRMRSSTGLAIGSGLAATVFLATVLIIEMRPDLNKPGQGQLVVEVDTELLPSAGPASSDKSASDEKTIEKGPRGKYVRHLYTGDEALWDAMLEEEIHLVDIAILRSPPAQQRQLWLYRKELLKQLAALRYQPGSEKYLL